MSSKNASLFLDLSTPPVFPPKCPSCVPWAGQSQGQPLCLCPLPPQLPASPPVLGERRLGVGRAALLTCPQPGLPAGEGEGLDGHGQSLVHTSPCCHTCQDPPLRATKSLLVTESQPSAGTVGRGQQPGSPLPQVDFYALRAEAYIQLCDFSSAAQNLRRAYFLQPENTNYLERLTLVLYLQVPGAALGPC